MILGSEEGILVFIIIFLFFFIIFLFNGIKEGTLALNFFFL